MDRGDYFEVKAAIQNLRAVQAENELRGRAAVEALRRVTARLSLPEAAGYSFDDATLTITPQGTGHVG
jgi:hypothetical protein